MPSSWPSRTRTLRAPSVAARSQSWSQVPTPISCNLFCKEICWRLSTCNSFLQVPAVFPLRRQVQIVDWVVTARCKCTVVLVSWHGADIFHLQNAVFGEIMFILCLQRRALRRWLSRCSRLRGSLPDQAGDKCLWVLHQWRLQAGRHSSGIDRAFCKCAAETLR